MVVKANADELAQRVKELEKEIAVLKQADSPMYSIKGLLNSIIKDAPIFLVVFNPSGQIMLMNATMLDFLGCTLDEVQGQDYLTSFVPDADQEIVSNTLRQLIESQGPTLASSRVVAKDGRELLLEWHGRQVFKANGELDYFWCLGIGITKLKQQEEELTVSEKKLNAIIRTVPDIIYRLDANGRITFISDSAKKYGYEPEDLIGTSLLDLVHPDDKTKAADKIDERRTGERSTKTLEARLLRKNQGPETFEYFLIAAEGLYTSKEPEAATFIGTQGIARDISDRKQAEAERLQREKLNSVVEIAGAICHELNQPLMAISGYSELILMEISKNDPLQDKINKVIEQVDKLGRITQKLMSITRYETKDYLEGKIIDIDKAAE
jgi:PAS domain S-box-containing protein